MPKLVCLSKTKEKEKEKVIIEEFIGGKAKTIKSMLNHLLRTTENQGKIVICITLRQMKTVRVIHIDYDLPRGQPQHFSSKKIIKLTEILINEINIDKIK